MGSLMKMPTELTPEMLEQVRADTANTDAALIVNMINVTAALKNLKGGGAIRKEAMATIDALVKKVRKYADPEHIYRVTH